jgi:transposase
MARTLETKDDLSVQLAGFGAWLSGKALVGTPALTFLTAIDDPYRFRRSSDVGAFLGLTPRRYQSGDVDLAGRISKAGDSPARSLLFEAANALMTRVRHENSLRAWG